MRPSHIITVVAALFLASCSARIIETSIPFDADEVAYISRSGPNTISGQALLRQLGGGVVTCAGTEVQLIPAGGFARERIGQIYGAASGGQINVLMGVSQENVPREYLEMSRRSVCDAQGNFTFENLANGDYYVLATVVWNVPGRYIPEGGGLARLVSVRGGQNQRIILS